MIRRALWSAGLAGCAVGAADALAGWSAMHRFVPGAGGKLEAVLLSATLLGGLAAVAGFFVCAGALAAQRFTVLARLIPHARAEHAAARARDPRGALVGASLVVVGLPIVGAVILLAYELGEGFAAGAPAVPGKFAGSAAGLEAALGAGGLWACVATGVAILSLLAARVLPRTALGRLRAHAGDIAAPALSFALAAPPLLAGALAIAWRISVVLLATRKHKGLVIVLTILAILVALAAALGATLFVARAIERALPRRVPSALWALLALAAGLAVLYVVLPRGPAGVDVITRTGLVLLGGLAVALPVIALLAVPVERLLGRWAGPLSHELAPAGLAAAMAGAALLVGYVVLRGPLSLDQLHLRPFVVALLLVPAVAAFWPIAARLPAWTAPLPVALLFPALLLGGREAPRKAAFAATGLTAPGALLVQKLGDLDRDGYSALLGGGDCDDTNRQVRPGAFDLPDDGIDQNCAGGDLRLGRDAAETRFVGPPKGLDPQANIVLVTIDTLRADHVGAYGYARPTTPALDALAAEGTLFENGWAHAPSTRYSMPAILTGRYPSQVAWDMSVWWPALSLENHTLAERLKELGFVTGAILNYHYFDRVRRMDQGFDSYDNENARLHAGKDPAATSGSSAREQSDKAIAFVQAHKDERFFLWVHYYDPHYRYERHEGTQDFGDAPIDLYDHEIRFTDEQIARLLAELKAQGLDQKTIVAVTGDHGEGFDEHGIEFHGYHLYAAQTKVPFLIRVPGVKPSRPKLPVGHVDLLPTLVDLAGGKPDGEMLGRSLVGEITGASDPDADRVVFQEVSFEGPTERRGAVNRQYHLLYNQVPDNTWELYDLTRDPLEKRDVSPGAPALREALLAWNDSLQFPPGAAEKLRAALGPSTPATPLDARFGDKVRLRGVSLDRREVRAGESVEVVYHFESLARLAGDYRVFVHVEGPSRFQDDHVPVEGAFPFSVWSPGQRVADRRRLVIPPGTQPGEYTIVIGLWAPKKGNLPLAAAEGDLGNGRLRVATLRVLP